MAKQGDIAAARQKKMKEWELVGPARGKKDESADQGDTWWLWQGKFPGQSLSKRKRNIKKCCVALFCLSKYIVFKMLSFGSPGKKT